MLAYAAADAVGLGHPVWAVASALIVSQETARETRHSLIWRVAGTLIGAGVAVACALLLMPDVAQPIAAMGVAIMLCAAIARRWPLLRVAMWTTALVILTASADHSILQTAMERSSEVLLGGLIGAAVHLVLDAILPAALDRKAEETASHPPLETRERRPFR